MKYTRQVSIKRQRSATSIRAFRNLLKLSVPQVCELSGLQKHQIVNLERGHSLVQFNKLVRVYSEYTGMSTEDINAILLVFNNLQEVATQAVAEAGGEIDG